MISKLKTQRAIELGLRTSAARRGWPATARLAELSGLLVTSLVLLRGQMPTAIAAEPLELRAVKSEGQVTSSEGTVNYQQKGSTEKLAEKNQKLHFNDALHTLELSWAMIRLDDPASLAPFMRIGALTRLEIDRPQTSSSPLATLATRSATAPIPRPALTVREGQIYSKHYSSRPDENPVRTPQGTVRPGGTEFLIAVDPGGDRTVVTMFDGYAELSNGTTNRIVQSQYQGIMSSQGIEVRPILMATNLVQWWIYYPGVLDPDELHFNPDEQAKLQASIDAYRSGDLQNALRLFPGYPAPSDPPSATVRLYLAGLFLGVGAVDKAELILGKTDPDSPQCTALRDVIAAAASRPGPDPADRTPSSAPSASSSPSLLLALSYLDQSRRDLPAALNSAKKAVELSARFGFGWARVAELEFSFGHTRAAREAAERALEFSPNNAQAHALRGFLLAAENRTREALTNFDAAIAVDPALGNAWLGRGLCKIRLAPALLFDATLPGSPDHGRAGRVPPSALEDLQTAALLEPNRSLLHSYLGKAFADLWEDQLAEKELAYARKLDPFDPTPWLYSALLQRENNRINPAIEELEKSNELNNNRAVYRSGFLLDEDRAVRSSSLANLYQAAGMDEVALREAARAVSADYANYSAHLFLSDAYNALRDPTRFNLRYETVWFNELLLANLLSPVGGTPLSQHISQQEYSRLFDRNRVGLSTDSTYRSDGQFRELASQFGILGNTAWSLDLDYEHHDSEGPRGRPNNGLDRIEWYTTVKQQLTPQDSLLLFTEYDEFTSGDNFQYLDWKAPPGVRANLALEERSLPINVFAGYHREWAPGVQTLVLGGWVGLEERLRDDAVPVVGLGQQQGAPVGTILIPLDEVFHNRIEFFSLEASQIVQSDFQTLILGASFQRGSVTASMSAINTNALFPIVSKLTFDSPLEHAAAYGYYTVNVFDSLFITAGLSYDRLVFPENFRVPPFSGSSETRDRLGPKAAFVWTPFQWLTFRGAFTRSLGGVSVEESYRLQPAQLAGFVQTYRTIISESLAGSVSAPEFETGGLALDLRIRPDTYIGVQLDARNEDVRQNIGAINVNLDASAATATSTPQTLNYEERSFAISVNRLLGPEFSVGAQYGLTHATLRSVLPAAIADPVNGFPDRTDRATLHQPGLYLLFNHPAGWFARADSLWYIQKTATSVPNMSIPVENLFQLNLLCGFRFPRQRGDISLGLLNVLDEDYKLSPLTQYTELPHQRTVVARLRLNF